MNGESVAGQELKLNAGANPLVLEYKHSGPVYFVVSKAPAVEPAKETPVSRPGDLAMRWWKNPDVLTFDVRADVKTPTGWYRFQSPPGLRTLTLVAHGAVTVWADGVPMKAEGEGRYRVQELKAAPVTVLMRIEQERGCYAGVVLDEPIRLECGPGRLPAGDWSENEGLYSYSGGAWYRKTVTLPTARKVFLDLGSIAASAEVRVNGNLVGTRVTPPWRWDISEYAKAGDNRIEVLVCNTLANHYTTVPTHYRGELSSGLIGPASLQIWP